MKKTHADILVAIGESIEYYELSDTSVICDLTEVYYAPGNQLGLRDVPDVRYIITAEGSAESGLGIFTEVYKVGNLFRLIKGSGEFSLREGSVLEVPYV